MLAGCATQPQVFSYPGLGFDIVKASPGNVKKVCQNERARCCWNYPDKEIWVSWDAVSCLTHELCHIEYGDYDHKGKCTEMNW